MAAKEASLHVRIPYEMREALEAIAASEDRTLSKVVERALADCVRAAKQKKGRGA